MRGERGLGAHNRTMGWISVEQRPTDKMIPRQNYQQLVTCLSHLTSHFSLVTDQLQRVRWDFGITNYWLWLINDWLFVLITKIDVRSLYRCCKLARFKLPTQVLWSKWVKFSLPSRNIGWEIKQKTQHNVGPQSAVSYRYGANKGKTTPERHIVAKDWFSKFLMLINIRYTI